MAIELAVRVFEFKWHIKEFSLSRKPFGECHKSPVFKVGPVKFHLTLYPRGKEIENYISLFINRSEGDPDSPEEVSVDIRFELRNDEDEYILMHRDTQDIRLTRNSWLGFDRFVERELVVSTEKNLFLPRDTLTIYSKMTITYRIEPDLTHEDVTYEELDILSTDLKSIFENGILTDLTIIANGGSFKVHESILRARAPELARILTNTEQSNAFNMETSVLRALLSYVYTGKLNITSLDLPHELCQAAEEYKLKNLHQCLLPNLVESTAHTLINGEHISFIWSISNFTSRQEGDRVFSPSLRNDFPDTTVLKLIFSLEKNENGKDIIVFYFRRAGHVRGERNPMFIVCNLSVIDNTGERKCSKFFQHLYTSEEDWKVQYLPKCNFILESEDFLPNNTITFNFDIVTNDKDDLSEIKGVSYSSETTDVNHVTQLLDDLENNMLRDCSNYDVMFVSQNMNFPVHRCILAARSRVFEVMFEHDKRNVIPITDIYPDILDKLLSYIYTGRTDTYSYDIAESLYKAANKYEVNHLKEKCSNRLKDFISEGYAIRLLLLADEQSDQILLQFAENYICSNATQILETPEWRNFLSQNSKLSVGILQKITSNFKERLNAQ